MLNDEIRKKLNENPDIHNVVASVMSSFAKSLLNEALQKNPNDGYAKRALLSFELSDLVDELLKIGSKLLHMSEEEFEKHEANLRLVVSTIKEESKTICEGGTTNE